jgi:hypothetical protein
VIRTRRFSVIARRLALTAVCFAALAGVMVACKQQEGDRCQSDEDCETGLSCNQATSKCASSNMSEPIDATTPDFLDAELDPDAPVDAPDDVMIDAPVDAQ